MTAATRATFSSRIITCPERISTTTGGHCVGILNLESSTHNFLDVIDSCTGKIVYRDFIDNHFYAMLLGNEILRSDIAFEGHPVLEPRASPPGNEYPQGIILQIPFLK